MVLPFPVQQATAVDIAQAPSPRVGSLDWRRFPDGESLVAIEDQLHDADVALRASLHEPDTMSLVLRFAAATAREFGARRVGMISPCLAYLRQDTRFHRGEAVSAPLLAKFLEGSFDWLVTADPYLRRTAVISLLYRIPAERVATALLLADWMRANVRLPLGKRRVTATAHASPSDAFRHRPASYGPSLASTTRPPKGAEWCSNGAAHGNARQGPTGQLSQAHGGADRRTLLPIRSNDARRTPAALERPYRPPAS